MLLAAGSDSLLTNEEYEGWPDLQMFPTMAGYVLSTHENLKSYLSEAFMPCTIKGKPLEKVCLSAYCNRIIWCHNVPTYVSWGLTKAMHGTETTLSHDFKFSWKHTLLKYPTSYSSQYFYWVSSLAGPYTTALRSQWTDTQAMPQHPTGQRQYMNGRAMMWGVFNAYAFLW